ncbi:MAG: phosphoribosylglycinamide formyltransferase [Mariprofundaceae bacterium]|nr:phosphoribosylglycinamide formyltransferase [Mariprofundaceae bacterium]
MNNSRIAVLASGTGSNVRAILQAAAAGSCPVETALVLSDKADAGALTIAKEAGVAQVLHITPKDYADRAAFDMACAEVIEAAGCHWVVLAGYMRILSEAFVQRFPQRIINIHPALLPAFPGADGAGDALRYGVKITGCTVHLVDEVLDGGPILAQQAVLVNDDDTRETLLNRLHTAEHQLYPATLARLVEQGFRLEGRRVIWRE